MNLPNVTTTGPGRGGVITGWGTALPANKVTNDDLAAYMDTSDEWITKRTGIKTRYWGDEGPAALGARAARQALAMANCGPEDIDLLILATCSPEYILPGSSAIVQHDLGLKCGAFDLGTACSGFTYSLVTAHGFLNLGMNRILVIGSEQLSRIIDKNDRGTAIPFGDGVGAVVIEACEGEGQLLGFDLGVDGSAVQFLVGEHDKPVTMDGKEVFRRAVHAMVDSANVALEKAKMTMADIDWVIPHQANRRIIDAAVKRLDWPIERTSTTVETVGNTSAASIPLALAEELDHGNIKPGDNVLMCGFGAGMTWASAVIRWGGVVREDGHGAAFHANATHTSTTTGATA
jgi:3-oxoacyl-[acyl-carrier-protein] synthase III